MRLDGKVGIVTGRASGIGKAIAFAMAEAGAHVVIADVDRPAGEEIARGLTLSGATALFQKTDVSK